MFTGLVREKGRVVRLERAAGGAALTVEAAGAARGAAPGDSVCVEGACLTVTSVEGRRLVFDVSAETLARTTLGGLRPGAAVNLEPALAPSEKLGGHFVLGHVDGVGRIELMRSSGDMVLMTVRVPHALARYLVPKGSVAVDGISLTVNEVRGDTFQMTLIPHTLREVTLGEKKKGDRVNIETDILVKSVERLLKGTGLFPPEKER